METEVNINGEKIKLLKYKNLKVKDEKYVVFINPENPDFVFLMKETKDGYKPACNMNKKIKKLFFDEISDMLAFKK